MFSRITRSTVVFGARTYYRMPNVSYAQRGLKPFLSEKSIAFHLQEHKSDLVKANNLIDKTPYKDLPIAHVLKQTSADAEDAPFFNYASSHFNHSFFWKSVTDRITEPTIFMLKAFRMDFGSFEEFKAKFSRNASSLSMPGYTWLVFRDKSLEIVNTFGSGSPYELVGAYPLLCLDVHEHAYYLDYQSNKMKYIANFWNFVDWEFVEHKFLNALLQDKDHKSTIEQSLIEEYQRELNSIERAEEHDDQLFEQNLGKRIYEGEDIDDIDVDDIDLDSEITAQDINNRFLVEEDQPDELFSEDDIVPKK